MSRRSLRHPLGGDHVFAPSPKRARPPKAARRHQPRIRPRRQVNVTSLVSSPEEVSSRPNLRLHIVGIVVLVLFAVMVLRLWSLQIIDTKSYAAAVTANHVRLVTVPAPRGDIVDRNDTALVDNQVQQEIVISATLRTQLRPVTKHTPLTAAQKTEIGKIAALVSLTPEQIQTKINNPQLSPYQQVPILEDAPAATVQFLQTHPSEYPGLSVQDISDRTYPQGGTIAAQVLGYTQTSSKAGQQYLQVGESGLEDQYNSDLTGDAGKQVLEVNAQGQVVSTKTDEKPAQGDTLVTNLDLGLQDAVQTALQNDIKADDVTPDAATGNTPHPNNAAAVVLNAQTGAVLAMASYPYYDVSDWVGGISDADFQALQNTGALNNYAIQGLYTPGSTFKLYTATAALQDGLITPDTSYDDGGTFTIPGCTGTSAASGCVLHDDDNSAAGVVNVSQALTVSSDDFFYWLGASFWGDQAKYGQTPIQNTAAEYGLTQSTGIDLPDESTSRVDSPAQRQILHKEAPAAYPDTGWYTGDNVEMAFGQGETVLTPIAQAIGYGTFANGGTRYQPEVGAEVVNQAGKVVKAIEPKVTGHVAYTPANYQAILQGLEGVINSPSGTAYATFQTGAKFPMSSYVLAGKTGTADVGNSEEPNAWFMSFGPQPKPQYVVAVVVNQGGYGAQAAAPAAAAIWNYLYANPISSSVDTPTAEHPVTTTAPATNPPAGTPAPTTTTTTAGTGTTDTTGTDTTGTDATGTGATGTG